MYDEKKNVRLYVVIFIFVCFFVVLFSRLIYIQFFSASELSKIAENQYDKIVKLPADRGTIYDRNYDMLALNKSVFSAYINPRQVKDKYLISEKLSEILAIPLDVLQSEIKKQRYFVWLKRHISKIQKDKLDNLDLKEVGFVKEKARFYPNDFLAAHIIGYTGIDTQGLGGIEYTFERELKGVSGYKYINTDAIQRELVYLSKRFAKSRRGHNVVLTIDKIIQYIIEDALEEAVNKWNAVGGTIIVMNPFNGEILGMANYPTFDPNSFLKYSDDSKINRAISSIFEPGSVFKIVTACAVLEEGLVEKDEELDCENGIYKIKSHRLHDYHSYSNLTFPEIIINSSNIGTVKLAQRLGQDKLYEYIRLFGFGKATGIDLCGEAEGILRDVENWSDISIASIPIGQEVGVTALQMLCAISAIANGGKLVRPLIVKRLEADENTILKKFSYSVKRRIISKQTADFVKSILEGVVEEGTGRRAKINGIKVAGKTGTAQKIDSTGRYSKTKYVASFMGFAPVENPSISVIVVIDEPSPVHFGGTVSAPVFKKVTKDILSYLKTFEDRNIVKN